MLTSSGNPSSWALWRAITRCFEYAPASHPPSGPVQSWSDPVLPWSCCRRSAAQSSLRLVSQRHAPTHARQTRKIGTSRILRRRSIATFTSPIIGLSPTLADKPPVARPQVSRGASGGAAGEQLLRLAHQVEAAGDADQIVARGGALGDLEGFGQRFGHLGHLPEPLRVLLGQLAR